jgi:hypothetical protein
LDSLFGCVKPTILANSAGVGKTEKNHMGLEAVECIYIFIASNTTAECRREGERESEGTGYPCLLKEKNISGPNPVTKQPGLIIIYCFILVLWHPARA